MKEIGLFYGHLVYFVAIRIFMVILNICCGVLCCTKKNLATLAWIRYQDLRHRLKS
jgi:hypothetical protein